MVELFMPQSYNMYPEHLTRDYENNESNYINIIPALRRGIAVTVKDCPTIQTR